MYIVDESEDDKECPQDYINSLLTYDDNSFFKITSNYTTEDNSNFNNTPTKCSTFFRDPVEPIWFGRV